MSGSAVRTSWCHCEVALSLLTACGDLGGPEKYKYYIYLQKE